MSFNFTRCLLLADTSMCINACWELCKFTQASTPLRLPFHAFTPGSSPSHLSYSLALSFSCLTCSDGATDRDHEPGSGSLYNIQVVQGSPDAFAWVTQWDQDEVAAPPSPPHPTPAFQRASKTAASGLRSDGLSIRPPVSSCLLLASLDSVNRVTTNVLPPPLRRATTTPFSKFNGTSLCPFEARVPELGPVSRTAGRNTKQNFE